MENQHSQTKVYLNILEKLKEIIHQKNLLPGDKLPSERELAETLNVGRSSVREALRAMELLGLIETRRGEGTFVGHFHKHRLIELLGWFVLQRDHAENDVVETRRMLEYASITQLINNKRKIDLSNWIDNEQINRSHFFEKLIVATENDLLNKIWRVLLNFEKTFVTKTETISSEACLQLVKAINDSNAHEALSIYLNSFTEPNSTFEQ